MNINEMIDALEELREELGGEAVVMLATQPNYPLRAHVSGVVRLEGEHDCWDCNERSAASACDHCKEDCDACQSESDENSDDKVCWILEGSQPYDKPYAPRRLWDMN